MQLTLMVTVDSGPSYGPIRMVVLTLYWSTLAFCSKWDGSMRYECSDNMAVGLTFMNIFMRAYRGNLNHYRGRALGFCCAKSRRASMLVRRLGIASMKLKNLKGSKANNCMGCVICYVFGLYQGIGKSILSDKHKTKSQPFLCPTGAFLLI
jgi:hypothetical protein